jgi:hypothetical protein
MTAWQNQSLNVEVYILHQEYKKHSLISEGVMLDVPGKGVEAIIQHSSEITFTGPNPWFSLAIIVINIDYLVKSPWKRSQQYLK